MMKRIAGIVVAGILLLTASYDVAMCRGGGGGHGGGGHSSGGHSAAHGEASASHAETSEAHAGKQDATISDPDAFLSGPSHGTHSSVMANPWIYTHPSINQPGECDKHQHGGLPVRSDGKLLVGLYSAKPGVGKSTTAMALGSLFLRDRRAVRVIAFADALREECVRRLVLWWDEQADWDQCIDADASARHIVTSGKDDDYPGGTLPYGLNTGRQLLAYVGEEARRVDPHVWNRLLNQKFLNMPHRSVVIIDDMRRPNEFDFVKFNGGVPVKLTGKSWTGAEEPDASNVDALADYAFPITVQAGTAPGLALGPSKEPAQAIYDKLKEYEEKIEL